MLTHKTVLCLILVPLLLAGCGDHSYLMQSIKGHFDLMSRARPIEKILENEDETEDVRDQLSTVVELRHFAITSLKLPDNGSYKEYADLKRPYAVWNMVAAPELSLELNQWCFPVVGCVTYRGYFDESSARASATRLKNQGFDVDVYGVQAYSTLNWFDDPILNTFLVQDNIRLASLLFHEMSHQIVYVPGDTKFNESFAKTVELEGLRRWANSEDDPTLWLECQRREKLSTEFQQFLLRIRNQLDGVYLTKADNDYKRSKKEEILTSAFANYEEMKKAWDNYSGFDSWMEAGLNNARLSSVATYYDYVPAFQELLRQVNFELPLFYEEVKAIAAMTEQERSLKMASLAPVIRAKLQQEN
jgi:predicted aminopeptidase